jgi:hypothetical protein
MAPALHSMKKAGGTATILLVDDEDQIRTMINRMLQPMGHYILTPPAGTEFPGATTLLRIKEGDTRLIWAKSNLLFYRLPSWSDRQ